MLIRKSEKMFLILMLINTKFSNALRQKHQLEELNIELLKGIHYG